MSEANSAGLLQFARALTRTERLLFREANHGHLMAIYDQKLAYPQGKIVIVVQGAKSRPASGHLPRPCFEGWGRPRAGQCARGIR
jgi:hypothetical protein